MNSIINDTDLLIEELKKFPHTYETILCGNNSPTNNYIIRRKVSQMLKFGELCKTTIPGTRFGKAILYGINKKYKILVKRERFGIDVYYFYNYKRLSNFYIEVPEPMVLKNDKWECVGKTITFFTGNILKFI